MVVSPRCYRGVSKGRRRKRKRKRREKGREEEKRRGRRDLGEKKNNRPLSDTQQIHLPRNPKF
jgi:hypothetical protein